MLVNELTPRVADGDSCGQSAKRGHRPHDSADAAPAMRQKAGPTGQQADARDEQKTLRCLFVSPDGAFCHDPFDTIFLPVSCFECKPARAHEQRLQEQDQNPAPCGEKALVDQPGPERGEAGNLDGECHRQMDDGGMKRIGQHGTDLRFGVCIAD